MNKIKKEKETLRYVKDIRMGKIHCIKNQKSRSGYINTRKTDFKSNITIRVEEKNYILVRH